MEVTPESERKRAKCARREDEIAQAIVLREKEKDELKYQRNRTQSLTIRLTPAEKKLLQNRAAEKQMSVTD